MRKVLQPGAKGHVVSTHERAVNILLHGDAGKEKLLSITIPKEENVPNGLTIHQNRDFVIV
jgi:hypothetical protein